MSNVPRPPSANRRVQEALQLFSELQNVAIADVQDADRLRTSTAPTSGPAPAAAGNRGAAPQAQAKAHGAQVDELRHKVSVADAIMKRLHKKNQELVAQLELRDGNGGASSSSGLVVAQLRKDIAQRDKEIQQLKGQAIRGGGAVGPGDHTDAVSSTSRLLQQLHDAERKRWQAQYEALTESKLELIAQGEATGKVNKEVKLFFQAMKQKLHDDAMHYDASRVAMNEALFEAEYKLASYT